MSYPNLSSYVLHTASPFPSKVPKDENEIILPAVNGTINVLRACKKNKVKKVVVTSSIAAVFTNAPKWKTAFDENDWGNIENSLPYYKSKILAERAAWKVFL